MTIAKVSPIDSRSVRAAFVGKQLVMPIAASVLLAAGGLKLAEILMTSAGTVVPNRNTFLVAAQVALACWMLMGTWARQAHYSAVAAFALFAGISLYKGLLGYQSCGCFGGLKINPWITFVFDGAMIAALLLARPPQEHAEQSGWRVAYAVLAVLALPALMYVVAARTTILRESGQLIGDGAVVILEPDEWPGRVFPLVRHIDIGSKLAEGKWRVVLYHYDCPECRRELPKHEQLARGGERVALIELPPLAPPGQDPVPRNTACTRGRLSRAKQWFVQTPVSIELADGRVTAVSTPKD